MRFAPRFAVALAVLAVAVVTACSSSSSGTSGGGSGPTTSVPAGKSLNDLSDSEAQTYCQDLLNYGQSIFTADEAKRYACSFTALFAAVGSQTTDDARQKCAAARDQCLAAPVRDAGVTVEYDAGSKNSCDQLQGRFKSCSGLTVGEYNGCLSANFDALKKFTSTDLCAAINLGAEAGIPSQPQSQSPTACDVVRQKCPALYGTGVGAPQ